ncbi:hypothetical protein HXX76_011421 [Chlamydomonas incerta]|uniref:Uncharacterized protein n=1 Tax=Chlamydomonas incerta TaxID=51695 RepID=A0A835SP56_CHLIN|nr:hypothetical protein HXX76_011421 [Chlamydomonas incerta]|eukprot:KAG2428717.1 hypothetical protein HXX76_011421 [Chlamydomonas incerta]
MSDNENEAPAVETADADEDAEVIRPETAATSTFEGDVDLPDDGEGGDGGEGGAEVAAEPDEPEPAEPEPAEAEPAAAADPEPEAEAAEPEPAAQEEEAEPAAKEEEEPAAKEDEPEPAAAKEEEEPAAKEDEPEPAAAKEEEPEPEAEPEAEPAATKDEPEAEAAPAAAGEGGEEDEGGERGYKAGEEGSTSVKSAKSAKSEAVGSTSLKSKASEHPDVVTDINESPEAHAEVDEMAQAQAREVMRSRQSSTVGEPKLKPSPSQDERRRSSGTNASVRSAATPPTKKEQQAPNESLAPMSVHPPSPSKIKQGPWLSGTYKLPKSGKIISGEELCDALLRMTNAYVDKMTQEQGGKSIPPEAATVFNTKKISQDEYDTMITRLYKPKDRSVQDSDRIQLMTLKYTEEGKESWQPVKQVTSEDQQAYMCNLYQRCLDNRKKTQEELAAKYLKPLGQPRKF